MNSVILSPHIAGDLLRGGHALAQATCAAVHIPFHRVVQLGHKNDVNANVPFPSSAYPTLIVYSVSPRGGNHPVNDYRLHNLTPGHETVLIGPLMSYQLR